MKTKYTTIEIKILKYLILNNNVAQIDQICKEVYHYRKVDISFINSLTKQISRLNKKIEKSIKVRIRCLVKDNCVVLILF